MKKAVFTGPSQPLKVVEAALPPVPPEGALVRTTYSGICHTDVHMRKDEFDFGDGKPFSFCKIFGERYIGTVFGHEIGGEIISFGEKAETHGLKVGDQVCVYAWVGCQKCDECKAGLNNMCTNNEFLELDIGFNPDMNGGYATHVPVPSCRFLIKVPESLPMSVACMLPCSGSTAYSALLKASPQIKQAVRLHGQARLLVIGAGGLGLWAVQLAKKALFPGEQLKVVIADRTQAKLNVGLEAGADEGVIWDGEGSAEDTAKKTTQAGKMHAIINFVGTPRTAEVGMECLHKAGVMVMIGLYGGGMTVKTPVLVLDGLSVAGSKTSTLPELTQLVEIVSKAGLSYPKMQFVSLEEVDHVLDDLEAGRVGGRTIVKFE